MHSFDALDLTAKFAGSRLNGSCRCSPAEFFLVDSIVSKITAATGILLILIERWICETSCYGPMLISQEFGEFVFDQIPQHFELSSF